MQKSPNPRRAANLGDISVASMLGRRGELAEDNHGDSCMVSEAQSHRGGPDPVQFARKRLARDRNRDIGVGLYPFLETKTVILEGRPGRYEPKAG
jgi:hypothetical protein